MRAALHRVRLEYFNFYILKTKSVNIHTRKKSLDNGLVKMKMVFGLHGKYLSSRARKNNVNNFGLKCSKTTGWFIFLVDNIKICTHTYMYIR